MTFLRRNISKITADSGNYTERQADRQGIRVSRQASRDISASLRKLCSTKAGFRRLERNAEFISIPIPDFFLAKEPFVLFI